MTEQQEKQIYSEYVNTHDNLYDIAKRAGVPYTEAREYIFNAFDEAIEAAGKNAAMAERQRILDLIKTKEN